MKWTVPDLPELVHLVRDPSGLEGPCRSINCMPGGRTDGCGDLLQAAPGPGGLSLNVEVFLLSSSHNNRILDLLYAVVDASV